MLKNADKEISIAQSRGFSELNQVFPFHEKLVQPFSCSNLANKETKKERNK